MVMNRPNLLQAATHHPEMSVTERRPTPLRWGQGEQDNDHGISIQRQPNSSNYFKKPV
jgi:hypothetical protein